MTTARLTGVAFAVALLACTGAHAAPLQPAEKQTASPTGERPLKGQAWRLAHQGFASFDAGRYAESERFARRALALRPDVLRLHMLFIYALQKQGRIEEALAAVAQAESAGLDASELARARSNLASGGDASGSEAFRKGFPIATQAFQDYNDQRYEAAAQGAEEAFRTDTSQGNWAMLWIASLEAQGRLQAAIDATDTAMELGAPNRSDLIARRQTLFKALSTEPAISAYQALNDNNTQRAVAMAREAVRLAPDTQSHRLLLLTALLLNGRIAEGEAAATDALRQDSEDTSALVLRGYFRQRLQRTEQAARDFDEAIAQDWLDDEQRANLRLIAADAALASGDFARVKALMAPLDAGDKAVALRLRQADEAATPPKVLTSLNYPPPFQDCHDTPYGTACEMKPADAAGAASASTRAYAAYGRQDYQEAIAQARQAVEQAPDNATMQRLLTITLAAGNDAQQQEALARLDEDLAKSPQEASLLMQRAYLWQRRQAPDKALQDFRAARATGHAPPIVILDEAYALAATGDKAQAIRTFKQAIDDNDSGELELTPDQRYFTRGAIAGLSREWGASVSTSYRGARPAGSGLNGTPITTASDSVFAMADVYWRPPMFLNSGKQVFEVYGRIANTLSGGSSTVRDQRVVDPCTGLPVDVTASRFKAASGLPTTIGSVGVRFTPSTDYALTFGLERRFLLGSATQSGSVTPGSDALRCQLSGRDPSRPGAPVVGNPQSIQFDTGASSGGWLGYVTWGFYRGTGLRFDVPSWFTMEGYLQGGYYREDLSADFWTRDQVTGATSERRRGKYRRDQWFANAELRVGRSVRMDSISDHLVIFPHIVAAADFQRQNYRARVPGFAGDMAVLGNGSTWSSGVGAGVSLRYAFREDHYNAARSYVDWTVQYRKNVGGGQADRAKGWFMSLSIWY